jgi:ABC-type multidrug transport system fused ATPase/permease subunit
MKGNMESYEVIKLRTFYQAIHSTCSSFLPSFGALLVLLYAGIRLLTNHVELSAGELTSFILYCTNLAITTAGISNSYTNIVNGMSAIQKVFEMMNYQRLVT